MKNCKQCKSSFEINDQERKLIDNYEVPDPITCPNCRFQHRGIFRNEFNFYKRDCDMCKESCITIYSPDKSFKVYCSKCWWSDEYDPLEYGQDLPAGRQGFDFNRPFFEQYHELLNAVPKIAIYNLKSENSDYTNYSAENRNCYMTTGALGSENCYYDRRVFYSKDIVDCFAIYKCEVCYGCKEGFKLYNCFYCENSENCSDLFLCGDCIGCKNCFGCFNLRNKEYCIYNEQFSKDEYVKRIQELKKDLSKSKKYYEELKLKLPHKALHVVNCENSTGDQLIDCKNCIYCFTLKNSEECSNVFDGSGDKYVADCNFCDNSELQYNSAHLEQNYDVMGGNLVWYSKNIRYSTSCFNSDNCFGCVGTKKQSHCIFNKQYSKDEYERLVPKIIEHMKQAGEWGQYYPANLSPFGYNESIANDYLPLSKEEAIKRGYEWNDYVTEVKANRKIKAIQLPDNIKDIPDDILNWAIECEVTGRPFKIIPQELKFYREYDLPIPHVHPEERYRMLLEKQPERNLFDRKCDKCQSAIKTTYPPAGQAGSPESPEMIYCEACYLKEVY